MKLQTLESAQNSPKIIKKIIRINVPVFINSNGNKILLPEPHKKLNYYMKLTEENKKHIDSLDYEALLSHWRFAPIGDPWFQDETGEYWKIKMRELRSLSDGQAKHVSASKSIGWQK